MLTLLGPARRSSAAAACLAALAYPVVSTDPNMLRSARMSCDVPSTSNLSVRRGRPSGPEAEQCLKGRHRLPTTIVTKDKFVQVDLQLRLADPMVRADQPLLQIADGAVR